MWKIFEILADVVDPVYHRQYERDLTETFGMGPVHETGINYILYLNIVY